DKAGAACAASGGRRHPVIALWPVSSTEALRRALTVEAIRKVGIWADRVAMREVCFDDKPADPFFNINTPADLAEAERIFGVVA
ncbi:MAG: molybdenum cofactor guanylyltransferase MobA, partial [Pseudomonadota bacterium]